VKVGVIDVGSNSVRLLVAAVDGTDVTQLRRERVYARLGDDAYRVGRIGAEKLEQTRDVATRFARIARKARVERLQTIVTAPGRQASNADALFEILADATRAPVHLLSADDEGRLAWHGAVARMESPQGTVAVVDLGGGSCEIAVGAPTAGPTWVRSRDAGALRVTRAFLAAKRLSATDVETARDGVHRLLGELDAPLPDTAFAVGGTARAVGRLIGKRFGTEELERLVAATRRKGADAVVKGSGITLERTQTLLGGTLVLAEIARQLESRLEVGRGGLREGAALALARQALADAEAAVA
jgi:exopolyphosphatase/guanosine-5'-triphosphate,3'-diphosphate pyrophosphatase